MARPAHRLRGRAEFDPVLTGRNPNGREEAAHTESLEDETGATLRGPAHLREDPQAILAPDRDTNEPELPESHRLARNDSR